MRVSSDKINTAALMIAASVGLAACGNVQGANLLFGQSQIVGFTVAGSSTTQGAELTFGYKDYNVAIVPVAVKQADGNKTLIQSEARAIQSEAEAIQSEAKAIQSEADIDNGQGAPSFTDSMSVLGQFELASSGDANLKPTGEPGSTPTGPKVRGGVQLGKFFATGLAARNLAEGFADGMAIPPTPVKKQETITDEINEDGKIIKRTTTIISEYGESSNLKVVPPEGEDR